MNISDNKALQVIKYIGIAGVFYGISIGIDVSTFSLILDEAGFSKGEIGKVLSSEMVSTFFVAPFIPIIFRKIGIFNVIIVALVIRNIFLILFGLSSSEFLWSANIFIFGGGGLLLFISFQIWINKITNATNRATCFGILNACLAFGMALGPIITTALGMKPGLSSLSLSAISCLFIIPILYLVKDQVPAINSQINLPFSEIIEKAKIPIVGGLVVDYIFFSLSTYIILYGMSNGLTVGNSKLLISYMVISKIFFDIPIGMIIDKLNRSLVMFICAIGVFISVQILPYVILSQYGIIFLFAFWSSFVSGIYIAGISNLGDKFKGNDLITANSALFIMNSLGAYMGIYATGMSIDYYGDYGLIISISAVIIMFILFQIATMLQKQEK